MGIMNMPLLRVWYKEAETRIGIGNLTQNILVEVGGEDAFLRTGYTHVW